MDQSEANIISSKTEILAILHRVVKDRLFVTVRLPGSSKEYTSTILRVDTDSGTFALDELFPADGDRLLRKTRELELHARVHGAEAEFSSRVAAVGRDEQGMAFYDVAFPATIRYLQRRERHRVQADRLADMPVELTDSERPDGIPLQGVLHDISGGGFSLWMRKEDIGEVEWDAIDRCLIAIEGEEPLESAVVVRGSRFVDKRNRYIVGVQFDSADPRFSQRVNRIVANLERRILRRKSSSPLA